MTKKHYVAIADMIARQLLHSKSTHVFAFGTGYQDATKAVAFRLADYFQTENKQFDRQRFLTSCGIAVESTDEKVQSTPGKVPSK